MAGGCISGRIAGGDCSGSAVAATVTVGLTVVVILEAVGAVVFTLNSAALAFAVATVLSGMQV